MAPTRHRRLLGAVVALAFVAAQPAVAQPVPSAPAIAASAAPESVRRAPRQLNIANKPWTGDFDKLVERRLIRVAAPYSRTLFFNDKGQERGLSADLARDFERYLNAKYKKKLGRRPVTVVLIPTTRDRLLPDVAGGLADIAIGNLTVTDERLKLVDMVSPERQAQVREIVLTGPKSPAIARIEDLAGKTVHVRRASSYYDSLAALNEHLAGQGEAKMDLVLVPDALEDEDMMEMLNAGLLQVIVVDDWKAKMWAPVLPHLTVHADVALREEGRIGWAIRKGSPILTTELEDFYARWVKKQGVVAYRLQQYMKRVKQLRDPTGDDEWKRFESAVNLFEKFGARYHFDPLMLAAQGYQESQIDQRKRSPAGAIGVMQIMPATGAEMKVGDIKSVEPNIHAGAKYMDHLMTKYFADAHFTEATRTLFAFASYNAGPGNIAKSRKLAAQRGLDPNRWFNNVEIVVAQRVGAETTTYVRNIYKYYVAYKLIVEAQRQAAQAREAVTPVRN
jgi:membrane-bound lytic murein transglycosylase MltF